VRGHVCQVFLDFSYLFKAQAGCVRLIVHFEVFDSFEIFLVLPFDGLLLFGWRGGLLRRIHLHYLAFVDFRVAAFLLARE